MCIRDRGTPIFPGEPIVIVEGPAIEAQLIETLLLVTFNHQSLICTKTNRIVRAAKGRPIMEFGSRRAQGYDAAVLGARAAYILSLIHISPWPRTGVRKRWNASPHTP